MIPTGRRSFFKKLGLLLSGLTVQGQMRAQDSKFQSVPYTKKYKKNSIPPETTKKALVDNNSCQGYSGVFLVATGVYCPPIRCQCASGIVEFPKNREETDL